MSLPVLLTSCRDCPTTGKGDATLRLSWSNFNAGTIQLTFAFLYSDGHLETYPQPPTSEKIYSCDPVAFVLRGSPSTLRYDSRTPEYKPDPEQAPFTVGFETTSDSAFFRYPSENILVELYTQHGNTEGPRELVGGDFTYAVPGRWVTNNDACIGTSNLYPSPINIDITDYNRNYCLKDAPVVIRVNYFPINGITFNWYWFVSGSSGNPFGVQVLDSSGHRIAANVAYLDGGFADDGSHYQIYAISKFEAETPDPYTITYYEQLDYFADPVVRTIPSVNFIGPNTIP